MANKNFIWREGPELVHVLSMYHLVVAPRLYGPKSVGILKIGGSELHSSALSEVVFRNTLPSG